MKCKNCGFDLHKNYCTNPQCEHYCIKGYIDEFENEKIELKETIRKRNLLIKQLRMRIEVLESQLQTAVKAYQEK